MTTTAAISRTYCVTVNGGREHHAPPSIGTFTIDAKMAASIVHLAMLVRVHDLHQVAKFDDRVSYYQHDPVGEPEEAAEAGDENFVRTEGDLLFVRSDSFYFTGDIRHTGVEVVCEAQSISELAKYFDLPLAAPATL